ncbi:hypothetical protein GCK72_018836 [Caenorhabditis remanei]|uniref:Uncharacterized protein n=1 Tax=Caenorhabditis remanei TaxID=31234 RepID=E3LZS1_CAERE|nr:hypothetical protein GCK72_018836 [Caenorhabditis remanei]EFO87726.1 hypothetical protein CRE_05525 [Caenorhabditis remanei]KAF1752282.1 hypothetical protein GCK72_018836 [Caenorhabditis remanei]
MADSNKKNTEGGEKGKRANEAMKKTSQGEDLEMDSLEAGSAGTSSNEQSTRTVPIDTPRPESTSDQPHEYEASDTASSSSHIQRTSTRKSSDRRGERARTKSVPSMMYPSSSSSSSEPSTPQTVRERPSSESLPMQSNLSRSQPINPKGSSEQTKASSSGSFKNLIMVKPKAEKGQTGTDEGESGLVEDGAESSAPATDPAPVVEPELVADPAPVTDPAPVVEPAPVTDHEPVADPAQVAPPAEMILAPDPIDVPAPDPAVALPPVQNDVPDNAQNDQNHVVDGQELLDGIVLRFPDPDPEVQVAQQNNAFSILGCIRDAFSKLSKICN